MQLNMIKEIKMLCSNVMDILQKNFFWFISGAF